jgi:serine protease AprX
MDAVRRSASKYFTPDNNIGYGIPNFAYADLLLNGFNEASLLADDSLFVYPTIFSDELKINIKSKDFQQLSINLYDLSGRLISQQCENIYSGFSTISIHPENISGGIYFLKIISGEKYWFEKIVKQ